MKIAVTADLHYGITSEESIREMLEEIRSHSPDALVVAGDLGEPYSKFVRCLELLKELNLPTAICAGNHDVWATRQYPSKTLFEEELPRATEEHGFIWLDTDNMILESGVAIAGSMMWYDYSDRGRGTETWAREAFSCLKKKMNNDGVYINWPWSDIEFASQCLEGLTKRLQRLEENPTIKTVIVATHVPMFKEQMVYFRDDIPTMRAYFANFTAGKVVKDFSKVRFVVSGHAHRGVPLTSIPFGDGRSGMVCTIGSEYKKLAYEILEIES